MDAETQPYRSNHPAGKDTHTITGQWLLLTLYQCNRSVWPRMGVLGRGCCSGGVKRDNETEWHKEMNPSWLLFHFLWWLPKESSLVFGVFHLKQKWQISMKLLLPHWPSKSGKEKQNLKEKVVDRNQEMLSSTPQGFWWSHLSRMRTGIWNYNFPGCLVVISSSTKIESH